MKSKNVKVVDQNNIDRDATVMFAVDLEGSEYVVYWIERDDDENNVFVSKVLKNTDGTSNLLDIESPEEKAKVSEVAKAFITKSVKDEADKLAGTSVTLDNGRVINLVNVSFNKEQRFNVQKAYITTVKKEVTRVTEKYYDVMLEEPVKVVEEVFPTVAPVALEPVVAPADPVVVEPTPVLSTPTVEVPATDLNDGFVAFGTESTIPKVEEPVNVAPVAPVIPAQPTVLEPITTGTSEPELLKPVTETVTPVVEPVSEVVEQKVVEPTVVAPIPEVVSTPVVEASQPLVFNATKETNLNAALGEVAKDPSIPVENITPVREFGVDEPVNPVQPTVATSTQPVDNTANTTAEVPVSPKSGFANSKFFMVVAIAFFLASCIFLGYEVFNYFQLTK